MASKEVDIPPAWRRGYTHNTQGGRWELRRRSDGSYDIRDQDTGEVTREVDASYVHAEYHNCAEWRCDCKSRRA